MIELQALNKTFSAAGAAVHAVQDVTLDIQEARIFSSYSFNSCVI